MRYRLVSKAPGGNRSLAVDWRGLRDPFGNGFYVIWMNTAGRFAALRAKAAGNQNIASAGMASHAFD
jgi:hypothetical protein